MITTYRSKAVGLGIFMLLAGTLGLIADNSTLQLAHEGKTDYQIVRPVQPTAVDDYAIQELRMYLTEITGADFPVIDPEAVTADGRYIFVGASQPARDRLAAEPWQDLDEEAHVAQSRGQDIFLYGKGIHGNLYAVLFFLEEFLGWRWYSVFEPPLTPDLPSVQLAQFDRSNAFSFPIRMTRAWSVVRHGLDFYYQQRLNIGFARLAQRREPGQFVDTLNTELKHSHSLFRFITPHPDHPRASSYPWLDRNDYFQTNPEYFSMWNRGERVDNKQLCFSNAGLRAELTANILKSIDQVPTPAIVSVAAHDTPGPFCYCEDCQALEVQYQSPGGPLYDYLIELCELLAVEHPDVIIHTLAYRRPQTQIPPQLPEGDKLPGNLAIDFAPVEDNYFADWTHPDPRMQETYAHLKAWGEITHDGRLWAWLYPNPWGSGIFVPVGNIDRLVTNLRLMYDAGVRGIYSNQPNSSFVSRSGFTELQDYLRKRLMQNIDADADAIIEEFTDAFYGSAAPLMRQYLAELEEGRRAMITLPNQVTYRSQRINKYNFPYLTVENIHRWQQYFDEMESLTEDRQLANVQMARRQLDHATLWRWLDLQEAHPEIYQDHLTILERIDAADNIVASPELDSQNEIISQRVSRSTRPLRKNHITDDLVRFIETGGQELPLPPVFDDVDPALIHTFVPHRDRGLPRYVNDSTAAHGYAAVVDRPNMPFTFGFFQDDPRNHAARLTIELDDIVPGEYRLYRLGPIEITHNCRIWFGQSWATKVQLAHHLYEADADNHYNSYASIKFDGPTYGGDAEEDLVLVDRVILVRIDEE